MPQSQNLPEIGQEVLVDVKKVGDKISQTLTNQLLIDQTGTVLDYKMTDGTGIGVVVILSDGSVNWFFTEEIKFSSNNNNTDGLEKNEINAKALIKSSATNTKSRNIFHEAKRYRESDREIIHLINPNNFMKWFLYSTKDIF